MGTRPSDIEEPSQFVGSTKKWETNSRTSSSSGEVECFYGILAGWFGAFASVWRRIALLISSPTVDAHLRWLVGCSPGCSSHLGEHLGEHPDMLRAAGDAFFRRSIMGGIMGGIRDPFWIPLHPLFYCLSSGLRNCSRNWDAFFCFFEFHRAASTMLGSSKPIRPP